MNPDKLLRVLGYNNLSIILMQERRHWLMKTDVNKQIQDSITGDIFQGRIDNTGSDVVIESKKLPYKYDYAADIKFSLDHADDILDIGVSALPYSATVNGLMYTRIKSITYQYDNTSTDPPTTVYSNYKIKFTNATECIIPFAGSPTSSEVYSGKWIRTSTPPTLMIYNSSTHQYSIEKVLGFSNTSNTVWYYPLEESLQPLPISSHTGTTYELSAVNNDNYIGYPLFWFTCSESDIGSNITFTNNTGSNNTQIMYIANEGPVAPYTANIYVGVDGNDDATPDGSSINTYTIIVSPKTGYSFSGTIDSDINIPISNEVVFKNNTTNQTYTVTLGCNENDGIFINNASENWVYDGSSSYTIPMSYFTVNSYVNHADNPLVALLTVKFDQDVPFVKTTSDHGTVGMRFYSGNPDTDTISRYPYNLNKMNGLPAWLNDDNLIEQTVQEHGIVYAMHSNSNTDPTDPETAQVSGLILDPGLEPDPDAETNPDSIGRVYVLSNDDIEYENNRTAEYPKPARTAARICDIPTSAIQLIGAAGLTPTQVVDKKYVRTETSYTEEDKNKVYNELSSRWVKPSMLDADGNPVYEVYGSENKYIFDSYEELGLVDMYNRNSLRVAMNLNPRIDVSNVDVGVILNGGSGYAVGDMGLCIVGGSSFTYTVTDISDPSDHGTGPVTAFDLSPDEHTQSIPLMNFDFVDNIPNQYTDYYGTAPLGNSDGSGLKFSFLLSNLDEILPYDGEFYTDLFALVHESDGLYIYTYEINNASGNFPKEGTWTKGDKVSEFEVTSTKKSEGGIATQESFINSVIPRLETLPITKKADHSELDLLRVMQTANCVTVVDYNHTPVIPAMPADQDIPSNVVDMCKFYCDGFTQETALTRTTASVIARLKELRAPWYDCYILWRWIDPQSIVPAFEYGIVHRGFLNSFTTDISTKLPTNELRCDNYVHFNEGTTVIWNVPGVGPMIWVYDPISTKYEEYRIDAETMDLHVTRKEITYADIDVRLSSTNEVVKIVDDDGNYLWNVITNNPQNISYTPSSDEPIYQKPDIQQLGDVIVGANINNTPDIQKMKGNWTLVFPRVSNYRLSNDITNTQFVPMKMECIKGRNIAVESGTRVFDSAGNDVSKKAVIFSEDENGTTMKVYNSLLRKWEKV
jgi:hypothetical protein